MKPIIISINSQIAKNFMHDHQILDAIIFITQDNSNSEFDASISLSESQSQIFNSTSKNLKKKFIHTLKTQSASEIINLSPKHTYLYTGENIDLKKTLVSNEFGEFTDFQILFLFGFHERVISSIDYKVQNIPKISEKWLILERQNKNLLNWMMPLISKVNQLDFLYYSKFIFKDIRKYCEENKIDRVFLIGPYKQVTKRIVYRKLRKSGIPYLICERGALPGSWFLDPDGFNADSNSYDQKNYEQIQLTPDNIQETENYIHELINSRKTLEQQVSNLESDQQLAELVKIKEKKKIIFIPLQRPADAVIKFFNPKGSRKFYKAISQLRKSLPSSEYHFVIKKHPLEKRFPFLLSSTLPHTTYVNDSVHINDILNISNHVFLINSGVGVLSLLYKLPVTYFGKIFYKCSGWNSPVSNSLFELSIDHEKNSLRLKFIYFLLNHFYFFTTKETMLINGKKIDFFDFSQTKRNFQFSQNLITQKRSTCV